MSGSSDAPHWLQSALCTPSAASNEFREQHPTDLLPGDIVVVGPYDDANACGRLLVIVDVDKGHFHGMLAIPETEFATSVDALLTTELTGLGYDIAVLTRFHGPVWSVQVRQRVGAIEMPALEQLERLMWNDEPADVTLLRGQPLQPEEIDSSYPARRGLSLEFDTLTEHYRRRCHDLIPVLDPAIADADVLSEFLTEPEWEQNIRFASLSHSFQQNLIASIPTLSKDHQLAARLLIEQSLHYFQDIEVSPKPEETMASHRSSHTLARAVLQQSSLLPTSFVLTHSKCWNDNIPEFSQLESEDMRTLVYYDATYSSLGKEST